MEPTLIEDLKISTRVPLIVNKLYQKLSNMEQPSDRTDVLVGLIYLLALECGFVPVQYKNNYKSCDYDYKKVVLLSEHWPDNWKQNNYYRLKVCLSGYDNICNISIIKLPEDVVVNSTATTEDGTSCSQQLLLDPLTYFTSSGTDMSVRKLQNLHHLSRVVKDTILNPVKKFILLNNQQLYPSIEYIPTEVVNKILSKLNGVDLARLGVVSKRLNFLTNQPFLWKNLLVREFNNRGEYDSLEALKMAYQTHYSRQKIRRRILGFRP